MIFSAKTHISSQYSRYNPKYPKILTDTFKWYFWYQMEFQNEIFGHFGRNGTFKKKNQCMFHCNFVRKINKLLPYVWLKKIDKFTEIQKGWDLHPHHLKSYHLLILLFGLMYRIKEISFI